MIVLDIGNTHVSCLLRGEVFNIKTESFTNDISKFLHSFSIKKVIFASVVPYTSKKLIEEAKKEQIFCREITIDDIPIKINIQHRNELGIDRAINAFVAFKKFKENVIVVDFGTALTFDIVYNKSYEGGMIFPGLAMAMHNLHTKTAKLPDVTISEYKHGIGKNTMDAISFGACIGYTGVLKETLQFIKNYYNSPFVTIFTGGSGEFFYKEIEGATFEKNLILDFLKTF